MCRSGITLTNIQAWLESLCERGVWRLGVTLCIGSALSSCYLFLNGYLEPKVDLLTPLDALIPYWPWSISVYLSLYGLYLVVGVTLSARQYAHTLLGLIAIALISFVGFVALTAHYPRPSPEQWAHSIWRPVIDTLMEHDQPGNTCPSLHVSTALYLGWSLRAHRWRWLWFTWALAISLSTLTLKQHFVWDWVGGACVATLIVIAQRSSQSRRRLGEHSVNTE